MNEPSLAQMREPFPANQISYLPKGGVKLAYVGHAALTDRLLDVDPMWNWEPLAIGETGLPVLDQFGGMWIKLTVCGVTRLGYGHAGNKEGGDAIKEVIGDAMRNSAMRFGAALDLWHKGDLHAHVEEEKPPQKPQQQMPPTVIADWIASFEAAGSVDELATQRLGALASAKAAQDQQAYTALDTAARARKKALEKQEIPA